MGTYVLQGYYHDAGQMVGPHYPVKREGGLEKVQVHWHAVAYANTYRADGRVETILPQ